VLDLRLDRERALCGARSAAEGEVHGRELLCGESGGKILLLLGGFMS
jgi:hypothetical protein